MEGKPLPKALHVPHSFAELYIVINCLCRQNFFGSFIASL